MKNLKSISAAAMKIKPIDVFEFLLRSWLGYTLIINSGVGTITPLASLGMPEHIYNILQGMWDTGFMMHLVKVIELVCGVLIILNRFVPLALVALMPVVVNIYGIHIFLFQSYFTKGLGMLLICAYFIYKNKNVFLPLLQFKQAPEHVS